MFLISTACVIMMFHVTSQILRSHASYTSARNYLLIFHTRLRDSLFLAVAEIWSFFVLRSNIYTS